MGKNTPAALAKKEKNVQAAQRLAQLQATQKYANKLRKLGFVGTDSEICQQRINQIVEQSIKAEQEKQRKQEEELRLAAELLQKQEQQFIQTAIDGPNGRKLKAFLAGRPATIERVRRFLARVA